MRFPPWRTTLIFTALAYAAGLSEAAAFDLDALPERLGAVAHGWRVSLPGRDELVLWSRLLVAALPIWLPMLALLCGGWPLLSGRRAALAAAARVAPAPVARWRALLRYALIAFIPVLLAFLVPVLWAFLAPPAGAVLRFLPLLALPVLAAGAAMALVSWIFAVLAAHVGQAGPDTADRIPLRIGIIAGLLVFSAVLRGLALGHDPRFFELIALMAELLAALLAWRIVTQQRNALQELVRLRDRDPQTNPPTLPERLIATLAERWHILGYLFIALSLVARFGVFGPTLRAEMAPRLAGSLGVLLAAGVLVLLVEWLHVHILSRLRVSTATDLRDRLALRLGWVLRTGVQLAIAFWALALILRLWGVMPGHLSGNAAVIRAGLTTLLALYALWFIWTLVDTVLDWSAARAAGGSTRIRTLLPFLRNFAFVVVATIAVMSVLSNIGVDVAPLLAGAGVVGIAIGIGAQKLVSDVITGIFIIFEDSIAIGETVEAAGKTGTVEGLTIRTLKLRDGDGALHSIPFSSITTLKNTSRGYGSYTVSMTILDPEDTDRALSEISRIGDEIEADPAWAPKITGPFSLWGVDGVSPAGVTLKGSIRTQPNAQWGLGREINRRITLCFAELGIAQVLVPATVTQDADTGAMG